MKESIRMHDKTDQNPDGAGRYPVWVPDEVGEVERMEEAVDAYFAMCDLGVDEQVHSRNRGVQILRRSIPYTIPGLALALGFDSRSSLHRVLHDERYKAFWHTLTRARTRIERQRLEKPLVGLHDSKMAQFDLKNNFDYKDKVEVENTGNAPMQVRVIQFSDKVNNDALECRRQIESRVNDAPDQQQVLAEPDAVPDAVQATADG
jgi:hypothetical protein